MFKEENEVHGTKGIAISEIRGRDNELKVFLGNNNIKLYTVWEDDWKNDKSKVISKFVKFRQNDCKKH